MSITDRSMYIAYRLPNWLQITLIYVPGHRNIGGNEIVDGLARKVSALDIHNSGGGSCYYYALPERKCN